MATYGGLPWMIWIDAQPVTGPLVDRHARYLVKRTEIVDGLGGNVMIHRHDGHICWTQRIFDQPRYLGRKIASDRSFQYRIQLRSLYSLIKGSTCYKL